MDYSPKPDPGADGRFFTYVQSVTFSRMPTRTKTKRRTQAERSEATVAQLIAAARQLFALDGYNATLLDDVVERAGVTKGALYHHFSSKADLFEAVFDREQRRLAEV